MVTSRRFRTLCLALDGTTEAPHFDRAAFRTPRRIYATLAADGRSANLKLSDDLPALVTGARPEAFERVKGGFGAQGWTTVLLATVDEAALLDALRGAHALSVPVVKKKAARRKR